MSMGIIVAAEARTWLGTSYHHQASSKGKGTDCLGLVRGIWRSIHGAEPETVPPYSAAWDEVDRSETLLAAASRWLVNKPKSQLDIGDVLLFRMRKGAPAKHLGICTQIGEHPYFIHAYTGHGVVETPLSRPWASKIVARFAFPALENK